MGVILLLLAQISGTISFFFAFGQLLIVINPLLSSNDNCKIVILTFIYLRVYQVANVKLEWNLIKTFPDLSGTG